MAKHKKPTNEELEENIKKSVEQVEAEAPEEDTPVEGPDDSVDKDKIQEESPVEETPPQEEEPEPTPEPIIDYKKKYTESKREALVIQSRNKKLSEAVDQASQIDNPTEEEMTVEFPDWDVMNETERRLATDNVINKRRFEAIHKASQEGKDITDWNDKVDKYIDDPKTLIANPSLEGKTDDFKIFASKPTRRGIDFTDLVSAFLYEMEKVTKPSKGKMFETGSGGPNTSPKPKSDKITLSEARVLMKTDYKKYKEYLTEGKIDLSSLE